MVIGKRQGGVKIKDSSPNEEKNSISSTKIENIESREICKEKK